MTRHLLHLAFLLLLSGPVFTGAAAQTAVRLSERSITIRGEQYLIHKVRKGETLYAIAKAYAVSQEEIMKANSLTRDVLRARQILLIPKRAQKRRAAGQTHAGDAENRPQERPEPQIEPITPSVPPRNVPRQDAYPETGTILSGDPPKESFTRSPTRWRQSQQRNPLSATAG